MGLDMYAFSVAKENAIDDFKIALGTDGFMIQKEELFYWRKHHDLHGWMERLYRSKGGSKESFNCEALKLTSRDLDALELDVTTNSLPETKGFFFGVNVPDEESIESDLEFISKAREAIQMGDCVYYYSWW